MPRSTGESAATRRPAPNRKGPPVPPGRPGGAIRLPSSRSATSPRCSCWTGRYRAGRVGRWCTAGDEPYVWWQADARAGKSALMAWFVLDPAAGGLGDLVLRHRPATPGRLTAPRSRTACSISSPRSPATGRHSLPRPRRGTGYAVTAGRSRSRAAKAGRRLVLVVDGLDEDSAPCPDPACPASPPVCRNAPPTGCGSSWPAAPTHRFPPT